jgi:hypothetical protein
MKLLKLVKSPKAGEKGYQPKKKELPTTLLELAKTLNWKESDCLLFSHMTIMGLSI